MFKTMGKQHLRVRIALFSRSSPSKGREDTWKVSAVSSMERFPRPWSAIGETGGGASLLM